MKKGYLYLLIGLLAFVSCKDDDDSSESGSFVPGDACFSDTLFREMEHAGTIKASIRLSSPAPADYNLEVAAALEYNATEGKDYILSSTRVPVKKGETQAYAEIALIDNRTVDPERYVELRIMDAGGGRVLAPDYCRICILDDESECAVVFADKEKVGYEANETIELPICLVGTPSGNVVRFSVGQVGGTAVEGRDFEILSDTEFDLRSVQDTVKLVIRTIDNNYNNEDRTLIFEVIEAQGAQTLTSRSNCLVMVKDDDTGLKFGSAQLAVTETENLLLIPIRLTQALSEDVEVTVAFLEGGTAVQGQDFTLENTVRIPAGQDSITLEMKPIYVPGVNEDKTLRLGLASCSDERIALDEGVCTVSIWDCDTKLTFAQPEYEVLSTESKLTASVSLEKALAHDVSFRMESENAKIFSLQSDSYTIPAGETTIQVELKVTAPAVQKRPEVPLALSDVYGATAGDAANLTMTFRLNKGAWSIAYVSSEEDVQDGPATAAKLIDDNDGTIWHNKWYGVDCVVPFEAVVDLSSEYELDFVELLRRANNADTKRVEIYTTADEDWNGAEWTLAATFVWGTDKTDRVRSIEWEKDYPTARYVKVRITQGSASNAASLAELTLHGWLK